MLFIQESMYLKPPQPGGTTAAAAPQEIKEHGVIRLRVKIGNWTAGTTGTVVAERGSWKLVEISDDQGVGLDFLPIWEERLDLLVKYSG